MDNVVSYKCIETLQKSGKPIFIVATVREAEAILYACRDHGIEVTAFCDTEKRKTVEPLCELEVIHTATMPGRYPEARFIIASQHILDVADQLTGMGYDDLYSALQLLENYDAGKHSYLTSHEYMESRITVYKKTHSMYFDGEKTYMRSLDIMVTTKCSMKCESCSNLMQYYTNPADSDGDRILLAVETLSQHVNDISEFRIIGGEPLMNRSWANVINGLLADNSDRKVYVYTNGTIVPKDEQLKAFDGKDVNFIITDYGKLSSNIDKLTDKLTDYGVTFVRTPAENWLDCSRVHHHKRSPADLQEVFKQCCVKYVYTLLDGRLYRCPFIANAANLNAIPDNAADYVDLFSETSDVKKQIERLVKVRSFFPACDFCDGRPYDPSSDTGYDGKGMINAGIQTNEPIPYRHYE